MARPRTVSDHELIVATAAAITAKGGGAWSLADVAQVVGVTPAAIVKRFGTKRGLLLAVTREWAEHLQPYDPTTITDPIAHLTHWLSDWLAEACDPRTSLGSLTLLFDEIKDPETRVVLAQGLNAQAQHIHAALVDAHQRGQLPALPPLQLAQLWIDLLAGAALRSAVEQRETPGARALAHIHAELERWSTQ